MRPEMLPLVQTMVVVQTLNHNRAKSLSSKENYFNKTWENPQRRQEFISFLILSSGKGRGKRQLQTWLN